MWKAIVYKEWLKTRAVFGLAVLLAVCVAGYEIINMNRILTLKGVEHIWQIMLLKDNMFVNHLPYIPLFAGIGIGLAQMLPEMSQKRLKLTLHLPYPQNRMILVMLATGFCEMLAVSIVVVAIVAGYDVNILAGELVARVLLTMLPWLVCGINAYFVTAAVCLESSRRQRCLLGLLGVGIVSAYYVEPAPEAYNHSIAGFAFFAVACALLVYRSVYRFKEGRLD